MCNPLNPTEQSDRLPGAHSVGCRGKCRSLSNSHCEAGRKQGENPSHKATRNSANPDYQRTAKKDPACTKAICKPPARKLTCQVAPRKRAENQTELRIGQIEIFLNQARRLRDVDAIEIENPVHRTQDHRQPGSCWNTSPRDLSVWFTRNRRRYAFVGSHNFSPPLNEHFMRPRIFVGRREATTPVASAVLILLTDESARLLSPRFQLYFLKAGIISFAKCLIPSSGGIGWITTCVTPASCHCRIRSMQSFDDPHRFSFRTSCGVGGTAKRCLRSRA